MWKTTFVASGYICFAVYFDFLKAIFLAVAKVIFRLAAEVDVNPQLAHGAHCSFEIALSGAAMLTLMLVCAFFSTQVQKYLVWVL